MLACLSTTKINFINKKEYNFIRVSHKKQSFSFLNDIPQFKISLKIFGKECYQYNNISFMFNNKPLTYFQLWRPQDVFLFAPAT